MLAHIVRRIAATIPVMAIVALFVFSLLYIAPGDPAAVIAGDQASPEDVEKIRKSLGLDRPFLSRFGEWQGPHSSDYPASPSAAARVDLS
jgi:peptide/nickel transport system permease protein